jgi:hypothetical protein
MPANKELERARSTQTAWGPRRSIQCCADHRDKLRYGTPWSERIALMRSI